MFENPIAPKVAKKKIKNPWDFEAPKYDQRTSSSVVAGDYYGTGFRAKVGTERQSSSSPIPMKTKQAKPESVV